jgi:hypothetical protein
MPIYTFDRVQGHNHYFTDVTRLFQVMQETLQDSDESGFYTAEAELVEILPKVIAWTTNESGTKCFFVTRTKDRYHPLFPCITPTIESELSKLYIGKPRDKRTLLSYVKDVVKPSPLFFNDLAQAKNYQDQSANLFVCKLLSNAVFKPTDFHFNQVYAAKFCEVLKTHFCSNQDHVYHALLKWIYQVVVLQTSAKVIPTMWALQGCGKTLLLGVMNHLLGVSKVALSPGISFLNALNVEVAQKSLIIIEECNNITRSDSSRMLNKLKDLSTATMSNFYGGKTLPHSLNILITSNQFNLPIDQDDNRFLFLAPESKLDQEIADQMLLIEKDDHRRFSLKHYITNYLQSRNCTNSKTCYGCLNCATKGDRSPIIRTPTRFKAYVRGVLNSSDSYDVKLTKLIDASVDEHDLGKAPINKLIEVLRNAGLNTETTTDKYLTKVIDLCIRKKQSAVTSIRDMLALTSCDKARHEYGKKIKEKAATENAAISELNTKMSAMDIDEEF